MSSEDIKGSDTHSRSANQAAPSKQPKTESTLGGDTSECLVEKKRTCRKKAKDLSNTKSDKSVHCQSKSTSVKCGKVKNKLLRPLPDGHPHVHAGEPTSTKKKVEVGYAFVDSKSGMPQHSQDGLLQTQSSKSTKLNTKQHSQDEVLQTNSSKPTKSTTKQHSKDEVLQTNSSKPTKSTTKQHSQDELLQTRSSKPTKFNAKQHSQDELIKPTKSNTKQDKQCPLIDSKISEKGVTPRVDLPDNGAQLESLATDSERAAKKRDQSTCPIPDKDDLSNDFQPPEDKRLKVANTDQILSMEQGLNLRGQVDQNEFWISQLGLFNRDKTVLLDGSHQWINDNIVYAALTLLHQQDPEIYGFQSPQCGKFFRFKPVPTNKKYVQVLHVEECHWITVSNIDVRQDTMIRNQVCIYDSLKSGCISLTTKKQIASLTKPIHRELQLDVMNIMTQPDSSSCGLFAIACCTDLVHKLDPTLSQYDVTQMRAHLRKCFENRTMVPFPVTRKRRVPLGNRIKRSQQLELICECRMPKERKSPIISCSSCKNLFHIGCVNADSMDSCWRCTQCNEILDMAKL